MSGRSASGRWAAVLAHLPLGRGGGADVRARTVHDLVLAAGRIDARVTEARGPGGTVRIGWVVPSAQDWDRAAARLAERSRWTALLLDGLPDEELERELVEAGVALVPTAEDLTVACSCGATGWCLHARAVHRAVGASVARDPWSLLRLAGGSRESLLARMRELAGTAPAATVPPSTAAAGRAAGPSVAVRPGDIALHPAPAADAAALVARLGPPPGVDDAVPLLRAVRDAAAMAWRVAAGEGAGEADRTVLLAQLRAGRTMTAAELAAAVGADVEAVEAELEALHATGAVLRTGSGDRRRYRAP